MTIFPDEILLLIALYTNYKATICLLKTHKHLSLYLDFNYYPTFWNNKYNKISNHEQIIHYQECHYINNLIINVDVIQQIIDGYKYNLILTIFRYRPKCQKKVMAVLYACKNREIMKFIMEKCVLNVKALKYISDYYKVALFNDYNLYCLHMFLKTDYNMFDILSIINPCAKDKYYDTIISSDKFIPHQHLQQCNDSIINLYYDQIVNHPNYNQSQMFAICESGYNNNLHNFYILHRSLDYVIHTINKDLLVLFFLNFSYINNSLLPIIITTQYIKLFSLDVTAIFISLLCIAPNHLAIILLCYLIYFYTNRSRIKLLYTCLAFGLIILGTGDTSLIPIIFTIILHTKLPAHAARAIKFSVCIRVITDIYLVITGNFINNRMWQDLTYRLISATAILLIRKSTPIIIIPEFICIYVVIYIYCFHPTAFICLSLFYNFIILTASILGHYAK